MVILTENVMLALSAIGQRGVDGMTWREKGEMFHLPFPHAVASRA